MSALPAELENALRTLADSANRRVLADASAGLSQGYRENIASSSTVTSATDALAYAMSRMPATFAAARYVLEEIAELLPDFQPATVLDAASGPGTASWAALDSWPGIEEVLALDHNPHFLEAGRLLSLDGPEALRSARRLAGDLRDPGRLPDGQRDLTILSYGLTELSAADVLPLVEALWQRTSGVLVLVEPGRPHDYRRLMQARDHLLQLGAALIAPCPHARECPLREPDWCHFSVRLPRSRDHRLLKSGTLGFEDEKFSYIAVARPEHEPAREWQRIIKPVERTKFSTRLSLCCRDGKEHNLEILKRDKPRFRQVSRLEWGDRAPVTPEG
ncbi:hypothetical protein GCM10007989_00770 [Devosia pacifica]|uniref:Uncharacterized protein n=1 Tax=Devosia pacifica TaxID=1335967 RepID=A0A918RU19_9HYPH|nr:small ribosomal subunit Rsm22 family protein [Devosia pacifica]GHA10459.1 hypothetical protein GCM10007989_00770 [Devosia pacifica]